MAATPNFEAALTERIESLSYLPTTVGVAVKFMQLGKDADADPDDYVKVISSDSSLCSKLLSLSNSSWFGVRNKVTKPRMAVNLLGLGTVRMLALSYCLSGLHNELKLPPEASRKFWSASLCKAVAAKLYAQRTEPKLAEEAFTAGLFEDFAVPVMYSVAREVYGAIVDDPNLTCQEKLQAERKLFKLDHTEVGRMVAQKMELPEVFVDAIAFHHNPVHLTQFLGGGLLNEAVLVSALLPHSLDAGNAADTHELQHLLERHKDRIGVEPRVFLDGIKEEFQKMYAFFEDGAAPDIKLVDLLEAASKEVADNTTRLVGTVSELMTQAASAGKEVQSMVNRQSRLEEMAHGDPLTGLLNRQGFSIRAGDLLNDSTRYQSRLAVLFLDLDHFKSLNDTLGHAQGDAALAAVAGALKSMFRQSDVIGRIGGDEFVVMLSDCAFEDAARISKRVITHLANYASETIPKGQLTVSGGLLWLDGKQAKCPLQSLLAAADRLMYDAKRAGGNRIFSGTLKKPQAAAG